MINTINPGTKPGNSGSTGKRDEILEKFVDKYKAEEKKREPVKKLGKDELFKLMVNQIQHQDPLKPYQNEQMASQMAQFTALEQMMNVNSNLEKLTQSQQPIHQLGASHLIGKYVTVDSSRVMHTEGKQSELKFELPSDAPHVRISVINERGENIREIEEKDLKKGLATLTWDGKTSQNLPAKSGSYQLQIAAEAENGRTISVKTQKTERVHGVQFEGKEIVLLTGDVRKPNKVFLSSVYKVVDDSEIRSDRDRSAQEQLRAMMAAQQQGEDGAPVEGGAEGMQASGLPAGLDGALGGAFPAALGMQADLPNQIELGEEAPMEGFVPGKNSNFTPLDAKVFQQGNMKAEHLPRPSQADVNRRLAEASDLTKDNPVAEAVKQGIPAEATQAPGDKNVAGINPAALKYYQEHGMPLPSENRAARNNPPTSEDGSVAGKWTE